MSFPQGTGQGFGHLKIFKKLQDHPDATGGLQDKFVGVPETLLMDGEGLSVPLPITTGPSINSRHNGSTDSPTPAPLKGTGGAMGLFGAPPPPGRSRDMV